MKVTLRWYNNQWNIHIESKNSKNVPGLTRMARYKEGTFKLRQYKTDLGFDVYNFGWLADDPKRRPGHGGEWSSRESIANEVFGTDLVSIAWNSWACDIDVNDLRKILPQDFASIRKELALSSDDEYVYQIHMNGIDKTKPFVYEI